jgi:hypothetical protein
MYLYGVTVNNTAFTKNTEIAISAETNPAISVKYDYYCDYMIIGKIKEK